MPPERPNFGAVYGSDDFIRQADKMTLDGAEGVLKSLEKRKAAMIVPIDQEIAFVKLVVQWKEENGTDNSVAG